MDRAQTVGITEIPVRARHTFALRDMPIHYRDPFDRLLLAQALTEPALPYTADTELARYAGPVRHTGGH